MTPDSGDQIGPESRSQIKRLWLLDALRGVAILAMVVYHLSWDLAWFAYVDWQVSHAPAWRAFAAAIAGSFLFLSGVSLALALARQIRWRAFWKREVILIAAAAAVSLITYFTFGQNFVRFGILHCMALGSLLALPFTRLPWFVALIAAAVIFLLPVLVDTPVLDGDGWLWTGLGTPGSAAVDYVPLAPWSGLILAGLGLAKAFRSTRIWQELTALPVPARLGRPLIFLGQKSLIIYLVHQPLLYGAVFAFASVFGSPDRGAIQFVESCTASCTDAYGDSVACEAACACSQSRMADAGQWDALVTTPQDPALRELLNGHYAQCLRDFPPNLPD